MENANYFASMRKFLIICLLLMVACSNELELEVDYTFSVPQFMEDKSTENEFIFFKKLDNPNAKSDDEIKEYSYEFKFFYEDAGIYKDIIDFASANLKDYSFEPFYFKGEQAYEIDRFEDGKSIEEIVFMKDKRIFWFRYTVNSPFFTAHEAEFRNFINSFDFIE